MLKKIFQIIWDFLLGKVGLQRKPDQAQAEKDDHNENAKIIAAGDESALNKRLDAKLRQ